MCGTGNVDWHGHIQPVFRLQAQQGTVALRDMAVNAAVQRRVHHHALCLTAVLFRQTVQAVQTVEHALFGLFPIGVEAGQHFGIRIQTQFLTQCQVIRLPVAVQRRHVMGGKGGHRLCRIIARRVEAAVRSWRAFKVKDLVGINAIIAQLGHNLIRDGTQILTDHHALVTLALQCQNRQQIIHRITDKRTFHGGGALRYPPQTQQSHDMIDTQCTAGFHIRLDQIDERLIAPLPHHLRAHWWQAPVLAKRTEDIRRRTDRRFQAIQFAITPGFSAAFGDADREVTVDTDQHAGIARALLTLLQLTLRQPLQPGIKTDLICMFFAKLYQRRTFPLLIFRRPCRPAPGIRILLF